MSKAGGITWTDESLFRNLRSAPEKLDAAMYALAQFYAPRVESYAKSNAPWQDQTGNARQGLSARAEREGNVTAITLSHSVPYGIWLEVRWSGKYAVILPTIQVMGKEVMGGARTLLRRMT